MSGRGGMNKKEKEELRDELDDITEKVTGLNSGFKILQMIVNELPKKRAEDDPHYAPF
jgi:hypothetical protein